MTTAYARFLSACFCLFLGGLLLWHLALPDRERSEAENRTLAQAPAFSWAALADGSYTKAVEEYVADQFPLRDGWTGLKARAEQAVGKRTFNGVYLCGDALIAKVDAPDPGLVERNLGYAARLAERAEVPVYLGLIPSAAEVWRDRLPAGAESWDQAAFLERAKETGLPQVDFRAALAGHGDEAIFYRTDHHWTARGAFYGANAVLEALGKIPLQEKDFTPEIASSDFNGTLYSTSGVHWLAPDTMEFWAAEEGLEVTSWRSGAAEEGLEVTSWRSGAPEPAPLYDRAYLARKDKYSAFLGGNQPLCVIENPALAGGQRLLLVRDSYSDALAPFLAQRFSEVHLLDLRYYRASVARYAEDQGIDAVCVLYSVPNFVEDTNLALLAQ